MISDFEFVNIWGEFALFSSTAGLALSAVSDLGSQRTLCWMLSGCAAIFSAPETSSACSRACKTVSDYTPKVLCTLLSVSMYPPDARWSKKHKCNFTLLFQKYSICLTCIQPAQVTWISILCRSFLQMCNPGGQKGFQILGVTFQLWALNLKGIL